ncbi:hypothetical protein ChUKH1_11195 [Cryptosporidium hominis]|uniref:Mediator of RNA polymerase II transcription subunit 11 n=1 Tax=Cryptosporidium hominis TaxID=237895 RepID=A0ABX5BDH7_CRYHO|nr:hypothetical protein ChTU502y2012_408g0355 [Cryptosporidium hominis]PPA63089.1 hypothetical protein ChUKH1_11195 [Cryptosporidium hominis]PPS96237.1 Uncharacterized protein GY17_00001794 [Cryptosporidium hominis]|eukprot:PPS96237.1 Uncharacterized protein GY17_00001794 [Cryptosporidium hominis]
MEIEKDILEGPAEFLEKTQNLLINILNELKETVNIISKVDPKKQSELEGHIISYYKNVNELSNVLNTKINTMHDNVEFQVNSTIERLMVENQKSFKSEAEIDSHNEEEQGCINLALDQYPTV